jgi:hypothetical protein
MTDLQVIVTIMAIGAVSIAMRLSGYLAAHTLPKTNFTARIVRLAPGNLAIAFVALGCLQSGWPSFVGSIAALTAMIVAGRQWAALLVGFIASALVAAVV